ncbi:MAG: FG-GAP-like repeat-containing protein [Limisphaerales bacterium]
MQSEENKLHFPAILKGNSVPVNHCPTPGFSRKALFFRRPGLPFVVRLCAFILLSLLPVMSSFGGPQLQYQVSGTNFVLAWPTNATGFHAQSRVGLAVSETWTNLNDTASVIGTQQQLLVPRTNSQQFFRLVKDSGTNPTVTALQVSTNAVAFGSVATLQFNIIEPDLDLAALVVMWTNILGSFSNAVSVQDIGLTEATSLAVLQIRPEKLPIGTSYFTLWLVDRLGLYSAPVYFEITIVGQGGPGTAPQLVSAAAEADAWQVSYVAGWRLKPGFVLKWNDPDSDIERIRATLHMPSGESMVKELRAVRTGFTNAVGTNTLRPFTLDYTYWTGTYDAEFQLIDRSGRTSAVQTASFELGGPAPAPPEIVSFYPSSGAPGTVVHLNVVNLNSLGTNFQFTLAGVPCAYLTNESGYAVVQVPAGAVTAPFKLVSDAQVTASDAIFTVPPVITLTSDRDQAAPGEPVQFYTSIRSATNRSLTFSVNGIAGGNVNVGLISSNGLYHAPFLPPTNLMTIVAALTTRPAISATVLVQVLPPSNLGGTGFVSSAQGGLVATTEGDAALDVPPGALFTNAFLSIATLRGTNLPPAAPGRRLLGAVRLGPDGTIFNQPVAVTLPLTEMRSPGTTLALKYFIRTNGTFVDEGLMAVVGANGREATGQILHFSEVGVDEAESVVASGPPQITSVQTAMPLQECLTVPVLITGQNLVPGVRIEVLRAGQPTGDVVPSNAIFETNRLGLLLTISTLSNFNNGGLRDYELRVVNSSSQSASVTLSVQGLNELIIPPGIHTNLSGSSQLFSEINVGAGAVVTAPEGLTLLANGPVSIAGQIMARGLNGLPSDDEVPGVNPPASILSRGGDGGLPDEAGHDGFLQLSTRGDFYYGDGGAPGEDTGFVAEFINAVLDLAGCISGNFISCGELVVNIVEIVGEISDMAAGAGVGQLGLPGARAGTDYLSDDGHGGGGGGGGGDLNWFDAGEGGGSGGGGGRGVFILTRNDLSLDDQVDTRGGDGGDGGENIITTYTGGGLSTEDPPSANRGGGGGGGSGGSVTLQARGGFRLGGASFINSRGGNPGNSLFTFRTVDINSRTIISERRARLVDAKYPFTPSGRIQAAGAVVPPRNLSDFVTDHGLLPVYLPPAVPFSLPVTVTIRGEDSNQVRQISFVRDNYGNRQANLLFFPGFNTVAVSDGRAPDNSMLDRLVLYLAGPDGDGDGLSDADEAVVGSNPLVADTDADGINDFNEVLQGLSPITGDSDGDLLTDADELNGTTDPLKRDTDGDGFWDGWELSAGTSANNAQLTIPLLPSGTLFAEVITSVNGRVLAVVNPVTGKMAALGQVNGGMGFGVAFTADGKMLASQGDRLVRLLLDQPASASGQLAVTNIGNFSTNGPAIYCYNFAAGMYGGTLLGIESTAAGDSTGQFLTIDPLTGVATRVGVVQSQALRALAVLGSGTTHEMLFASSAQSGAADALLSFPAGPGGAAQSVGSLLDSTNVYGLTPMAPNRLYAALTGSQTTRLMLLNATNAAMTLQTTFSAPVFDLALAPCPAPCLNGPFLSPLPYPGQYLASADFNGDTLPDLAVTVTRTIGSEQFIGASVMHGKGDGTFTNAASYFFSNARSFSAPDLALADVNGDGRTDIIVMQPAVFAGFFHILIRPAELMTLLADNQGGFQPPIIQAMPPGPAQALYRIAAADWSGDGLADLAFVNESLQACSFQGNGGGLFTNAVALLPDASFNGVLLADVNADGRPDFLGTGSELIVRLSDGTGGFLTNQNYTGSGTYLNVGDVDGDGDRDVVATGYGAVPTVFYNAGSGMFPTNTTFNPHIFPNGVFARAALGDLNGDGRADAVVPSLGTKATAFISGQVPVTLAHTMTEPASAPFEAGIVISSVILADVDHDGLLDVVSAGGNSISTLLGEESF